MHEFPSPKDRIRRILEAALAGCTYVSSRNLDDGSTLTLEALSSEGRQVNLRFRGVRESESTAVPEPGAAMSLKSVGRGNKFSLLSTLLPILKPPSPSYARVRIDAGAARLDIVCQDVEWWEDQAPPGQP